MSFFSTPSQPANQAIKYTGLQVQTAVNTLPVPIVMGHAKLAPNIIDYDDYRAVSQNQGGGGKGGGVPAATSYEYYATLIMALCEGPIGGVTTIWKGNATTTLAKLGFTLFTGTTPQTSWSYMSSKHAAKALGYSGTAYVAVANYDLGGSPSLSNHNFEVKGLHYGSGVNGQDADPTHCIMELLTNPQWGAGFPASSIDLTSLGLGSYAGGGGGSVVYGRAANSLGAYCQALGLSFSPCLSSVETASSVLQRWVKLTNCAAVWSGTALKFIPYGDESISGNGVTYVPDVTPVYDLTDDDFIAESSADPVEVTRSDVADAKNVVRVEISDRANAYNLTPVEARDETMVNLYGLRVDSAVTAHEICDPAIAATVGQLVLQRGLYIRNTYRFKLSWEYCLLEPMDIVTLSDPGLGLARAPVRITAIEEDDQGLLTVTAEEFPAGIATATQYPKQARDPYALNYDLAAAPVNTPVIFEPQSSLTGGDAEVWIGVSGGLSGVADPSWGGCHVWLSPDGVSYKAIGKIAAPARQGVLSAAVAGFTGTNPDNINTLGVDLTMSGGVLLNATAADAGAARTLCYVDGELVAYATASLTSAHHYNLTGLQRGLYGTSAGAHGPGSQFLRLDDAIFKYVLPAPYVGTTLHLKFQSFNIWGGGLQDIADCAEYVYGPNGAGYLVPTPAGSLTLAAVIPAAPTSLIATGGENVIVVSWARNPEADVLGYLVWSAEGRDASFADAAIVAQVSALTWTHANLSYGETRTYWLEAYSSAGSSSPTGPAYATTAFTIPVEAIGEAAIASDKLIPLLAQQIAAIEAVAEGAVVSAAQAGLAQSLIAVERYTRASAVQAVAAQITTVQASLDGTIASVQGNINTVASNLAATAAELTTVSTTLAGNTASIAANMSAIDGLQARYTVQVEIDTGGRPYIGGFGVAGGPDGAGGIAFNATFLVNSFTIAQLNGDGSISTVSPFTVSGGNVYIQNALIGAVAANKITSGTIATAALTIAPANSSQGLFVYNAAGQLILDSAHGIYPGAATAQSHSTQTTGWSGNQVLGVTWSSAGHGALCFVNINTSGGPWAPGNYNVNLAISVDGTLTYTYLNLLGGGATPNLGSVSFALPALAPGSHTIRIDATTASGGPPAMNTGSSITVIDFKA